jgi:hypothetical protein
MIIVPKGIKDLPASWQELYLDLRAEKESEEIFDEVKKIDKEKKTMSTPPKKDDLDDLGDLDGLDELEDGFGEFESLDSVIKEEDEDNLYDEFDENTHDAWLVDNAEDTSGLSPGMRDIFDQLDG